MFGTVHKKRLPLLRGCCHSLTECLFHQILLPTEHLFHSPPQGAAGQRNRVWKIQAVPSGVGWDTSPWKRVERNTADLHSWDTRALHFRQKPWWHSERRSSPPGTEHVAHPQHLHYMVLQRFRSAGYTVLQTNSQGWWDTADGACQLSGPSWFAIPSAEFCLLGPYQAFNWIQETL